MPPMHAIADREPWTWTGWRCAASCCNRNCARSIAGDSITWMRLHKPRKSKCPVRILRAFSTPQKIATYQKNSEGNWTIRSTKKMLYNVPFAVQSREKSKAPAFATHPLFLVVLRERDELWLSVELCQSRTTKRREFIATFLPPIVWSTCWR